MIVRVLKKTIRLPLKNYNITQILVTDVSPNKSIEYADLLSDGLNENNAVFKLLSKRGYGIDSKIKIYGKSKW